MSDPNSTERESTHADDVSADAFFEPELWTRLHQAGDPSGFASAWLELQCQKIGGVERAVVVMSGPSPDSFAPVAVWPEDTQGSPGLASVVEVALREGKGVVRARSGPRRTRGAGQSAVALPILVNGQRCGVVALEVAFREEAELRNILRQLEWGGAWLEVLVRRKIFSANDRLIAVLGLLATSVHHDRFQAAATAMVTEVASTLDCERVSIGFIRGQRSRLRALSHSASFNKKSNLIRAIEAAMDEAVDQQATVVYPARTDGPVQVTRAHAELGRDYGTGALCSVPFGNGSELLGAFCLERRAELPFDERTVELCEHVASVVGPVLDVKRLDDRWLIIKAWDALVTQARNLVGPRHVLLKLSAAVVVLVTCFLVFAKGDYRISSDALLEGTVQRVIAAPMMGYVADANVRAGDIVAEGEVLCTLDDADLRLERVKWAGQRAQRMREYNEALAKRELARVRILAAQLDQADAQLALLDEQLARTRIVAPFDGIVVSGDLSQSLGAPVERGEVLFEVAPLDTYRVVLQVDERDITNVSVGQDGHLALAALPNETHPFVVEKITPVSTSEEGLNYFRVEAHLEGDTTMLRPGMEGVGKIEVDERKLIWIWTHKFVHWVKMWFWSWWP